MDSEQVILAELENAECCHRLARTIGIRAVNLWGHG